MSCRVLGRRVEEATLAELVRLARERGVKRLVGRWIPSGRNGLVEQHYAGLGFEAAGCEGKDTLWTLELEGWRSPDLPFRQA